MTSNEMDLELLCLLFDFEKLISRQMCQATGRLVNSVNRSLARLRERGLVASVQQQVNMPAVWYLSGNGAKLVAQRRGDQASDEQAQRYARSEREVSYSQHDVEAADLVLCLIKALDKAGLEVPELWSGKSAEESVWIGSQRLTIRPDHTLSFSDRVVYIEYDRGTRDLRKAPGRRGMDMAEQVDRYARAQNALPDFRLLVISPSFQRSLAVQEVALEASGRAVNNRGYTDRDRFLADPLGDIWLFDAEVAQYLNFLGAMSVDQTLGVYLKEQLVPDVLSQVPKQLRRRRYITQQILPNGQSIRKREPRVRQAFFDALEATGKLPRYAF